MGYPYRCRHCETRHTFKHEYDWYVRQPKCRQCGKSNFRLDKWMLKRDTKKMGCDCPGYPFYHRKSSYFCWYRADGTGRYPGDPDFHDRYGDYVEDVDSDIPFDLDPVIASVPDQYGEAIVPF